MFQSVPSRADVFSMVEVALYRLAFNMGDFWRGAICPGLQLRD